MQWKYPNVLLFFSCLVLSAAGHAVFLSQWARGHFMIGIDDGASQMMPFKKLLYEQYSSGEFFYSFDFGLGAGTFSELSYYFSTSIVFLVTAAVVFALESIHAIKSTDVLFWANAAVFISIIRLAFVLFITNRLFTYMGISKIPAFTGAALYGLSGMYFRHTVYWEFFADAYLWLPLLILGAEKVFREHKSGWFLLAVSISLIDNFYFAYINFLLTAIYIMVRLFMPLAEKEISKWQAIGTFLSFGLLGLGISAISFVPAVYAYLNNHRPAFQEEIEWVNLTDNILFTSRYIVMPTIFLLFLAIPAFYRNRLFRLFALLALVGTLLHYSPLAASLFNGFSAPQYRWEYFMALMIGGAVAAGLDRLGQISMRQLVASSAFALLAYNFAIRIDGDFDAGSWQAVFVSVSLPAMVLLLAVFIRWPRPLLQKILAAYVIVSAAVFANLYQADAILDIGRIENVNEELLTTAGYDSVEIRELLEVIHAQESDPMYRIDWMEDVRNNTPIVQEFRGLSAYSSILNKNLLYFYLYDLEIDMGRESVSRYATLGNRANLHSLLQGKYAILEKGDPNVPYGFEELTASENFIAYRNTNNLPFARSASDSYSEASLAASPPLFREHAMLSGIVLNGDGGSAPLSVEEQTQQYEIQEQAAVYDNGTLEVQGETGGIDLTRKDSSFTEGDLYVSFHLENDAPSEGIILTVNGYETSRKANDSIYRTYVDDLTIRIPADDIVQIRLPQGNYRLTELQVFEEPYEVLKAQAQKPSGASNIEIDGSTVTLDYDNVEQDEYLLLSIPYERGWSASVNGEPATVLEANYAFVAVPIEAGINAVEFTYKPPYFGVASVVSFLSALAGLFYIFFRKRRFGL
ncbi:MAG TPA: YfhO family protein [Planococcus sp. (in: firmicutes)]|nr:YfhO family protein [Planococcus sp. (in: firmicutes)]